MSASLPLVKPCQDACFTGIFGVHGWNFDRVVKDMSRLSAALVAKTLLLSSALCLSTVARSQSQTLPAPVVLPLDVAGVSGVIAVEIDGVDMTEFVQIETGQIVIAAGAPLSPGRHEAIVYVLSGTSYSVFATYSFETDASTLPNAGVNTTVIATHEVGVRSVNGEIEEDFSSAGEVRVETLDESITAWVTYLATSRKELQLTGRAFDIGEYSIELRRSGAFLDILGRIGHQTLSYDTALISEITRRGVSVEVKNPSERLQFGVFGLKTSNALGADNILGIAKDDDRMFGAQVAVRPFWSSDIRLSLQTYEGKGIPQGGTLTAFGSGSSIGLDGSIANGRWRYGLNYARTETDFDGAGPLEPDTGDAVLASLDYDLLEGDDGRFLTLGFDYERVGVNFYSLANPILPAGGETFRITADYTADRLTLFGTLETTETNVQGNPSDQTDRVSKVALDGTWLFYGPQALSDATLNFGIAYDWIRRVETPMAAPPPEPWDSITLYAGLDKITDLGGWGVGYTFIDQEDGGPSNLDLRSHQFSGWIDRDLSQKLSFNASTTVGFFDDSSIGNYYRHDANLGILYDIDPGSWALSLDMGLAATDQAGVENGAYVASEIVWTFTSSADLVFNLGYYDGSFAKASTVDHDAIVGLLLRVRTNVLR